MRWSLALAACLGLGCHTAGRVGALVIRGDMIELHQRPAGAAASSPRSPQILILGLDGVSRKLLYDMLRAGELPSFSELLGGDNLAHAALDEHLLSNLPSTTMPAWSSVFSGFGAAETGVPNNEYFVRETRTFECPDPISFQDAPAIIESFTDGYLNSLVGRPTLYDRIHAADPDALVWVVMHQLFRGADTFLLAKRTVIAKAFEAFIDDKLAADGKKHRDVFAALDQAAVTSLVSHLEKGPVPDVLTLYLSGTDLYAHVASEGPDESRRAYLREVVDPALRPLVARMRERGMLADRWVVVTADHGHTQVVHDAAHSLDTSEADAPGVLHKLGFHLRPFKRHVDAKDPFNAVLALGGAMGFVYLADRAHCDGSAPCDWRDPPRYREDVLAVANAFFTNNEDGALAPGMKGALDMIFVRKPRPVADIDLPFEVYVGDGKTMSIDDYLAAHPHPTYVDLAHRMEELAVGSHGERAGDILLLTHNGDRDKPEDRYYFATPYNSWHGSPSRQDSEIPLIVAHPAHAAADIDAWVTKALGDRPYQRKVTDLVLGLRRGELNQ